MKTAIYIEDGTVQLVITPENEFEKNSLKSFEGDPIEAEIFIGGFYDCRGGWVNQKAYINHEAFSDGNHQDSSLIIKTKPKSS